MICSKCGSNQPDGATFCESCGAAMTTAPAPTGNFQQGYQQQGYQQQGYQQQGYQQPAQTPYSQGQEEMAPVVSIGSYIGRMLLACIPLVGLIMQIVWACSESNRSKRNFAIANLIMIGIGILSSIILGATIASLVFSIIGELGSFF